MTLRNFPYLLCVFTISYGIMSEEVVVLVLDLVDYHLHGFHAPMDTGFFDFLHFVILVLQVLLK